MNLPLITPEDAATFDAALAQFIASSGARLALLIDRAGFILTKQGDPGGVDMVTLGALAANSFAATAAIGGIIEERSVNFLYQEGRENSLLMLAAGVDGYLAAVFPAGIGVGTVKFFAEHAVEEIAPRLAATERRSGLLPEALPESSLTATEPLFRRRAKV
jgi:predicted regulator of Ras-like GTPase activity (Roadblock/LC7/MglB family)